MSINLHLVQTQMDPATVQDALAEFPMVAFRLVDWRDLPACQGCPTCDPSAGCDSTAVLFSRRYLRWDKAAKKPVHSHWTEMSLGACCLSWEIRELLRNEDPDLEVRVELLREIV